MVFDVSDVNLLSVLDLVSEIFQELTLGLLDRHLGLHLNV